MNAGARLRLVGAIAYGAGALVFLSTLVALLVDVPGEGKVTLGPVTALLTAIWVTVMLLPFWALRWIHPDPRVRVTVVAFVVLLVAAEVVGMGYRMGGEQQLTSPVLVLAATAAAAHLLAGLALGILIRRRPAALRGLHVELSWALIAYALLTGASMAFPQVMVPLSGVALTVVYLALGLALRRAAADEH